MKETTNIDLLQVSFVKGILFHVNRGSKKHSFTSILNHTEMPAKSFLLKKITRIADADIFLKDKRCK